MLFRSGISNGLLFVQAPSLILEWLARQQRVSSSGLVYLGVCVGLILSSLLVSLSDGYLLGAERWWPAALLSIPLAWWGWRQLSRLDVPDEEKAHPSAEPPSGKLLDRSSTPLFLSYAGAGMGYILPMTFLPMVARLQVEPGDFLIGGSWLVVALATLPSPWLWNRLGVRMGDDIALRFADLELPAPLLSALTEVGYETPSPIQAACIPLLLAGRDILGEEGVS